MRNALLEPARGVAPAAVLFAALALGVGKPAWGNASVTEEQAQAAAVAARIADDEASAPQDDGMIRNVETVVWSEPEDPPAWFPTLDETDLTISPSPMQTENLAMGDDPAAAQQESVVIANEHTVIPLPAGAWTGLAGLVSLGTIRGRKAIIRFFT